MAHDWVASLGPLLWTDAFLKQEGTTRAPSCAGESNSWFADLNAASERSRLTTQDGETGKVRTLLLAAKSPGGRKTTLTGIAVGDKDCNRPLYKDGVPRAPLESTITTGAGDGTVPLASATLKGIVAISEETTWEGEHSKLVGITRRRIIEALTGRTPTSSGAEATFSPEALAGGSLAVAVRGSAQPLVTTPSGRAVGFDPSSGADRYDVSGAEVSAHPVMAAVTLPAPEDGQYTVTLASAWPGVAHIAIGRQAAGL